jgi:hypothetical protein
MIEKPNIRDLSFSTKNLRLFMITSLEVLSCSNGRQSLQVAVKKEGYNVGMLGIPLLAVLVKAGKEEVRSCWSLWP